MARLLYITYGSYRVGLTPTSSAVELEDRYSWESSDEGMTLAFQVLISAATPALYDAARTAFAAAMLTPDQALTVVMDSDTRLTYAPSANTGLNTRGSVRKVPGRHNTARSGRFTATITCEIPMDASGRAGRRNARVQVFETPSGRRRAVVEAEYTAATTGMGGVAGARATYEAGIGAFCDTTLTALGGTWELLHDPSVATDQNDKIARGVRVYQEILYAQGLGSVDVSAIRDQRLTINRVDQSINDTVLGVQGSRWSVAKLQILRASYDASIDSGVTQGLKDLWENTILPRIDKAVSDHASSTTVRSSVNARFDPVENRISGEATYLADVGGALQSMRESLAQQTDHGVILRPVWDGQLYTRIKDQGPANQTRTLTRQYTARAGAGGQRAGADAGGNGALGIFGIGAGLGVDVGGNGVFGIGANLGLEFISGGAVVGGALGGGAGGSGGKPDVPPDQGSEWHLVQSRDRESPFSIGAPGSTVNLEGWVRSWVWVRGIDVSTRPQTGNPGGAGATRTR